MPTKRTFADNESQILFLMMVCKMRGLSYKQIQAEIEENLHIHMSIGAITERIHRMTENNVKQFHDLKSSNDAYISNVIELKNHMDYYRRLVEATLHKAEFRQYVTPRLIYKAIEILKSIDETEFAMLKQMPDLFAWGGLKQRPGGTEFGEKNQEALSKTVDQFIISMEQIPVARDIEALQRQVEDKSLGAFQQKSELKEDKPKS